MSIYIDPEKVIEHATRMASFKDAMVLALEQCKTTVDATETSWQSQTGTVVRSHMKSLSGSFSEVDASTEKYIAFLRTTVAEYQDTEEQNNQAAEAFESNLESGNVN